MAFRSPDFYAIDELFSEEDLLLRQTVRKFVDDKILPIIREHFNAGTFPSELVPEFGALGLLGANIHGYGCAGLSNVAYGLIMQELERGDSGVRSFASVQGSLVMYPILSYGSEEQKETWLPKLASGEAIGCFGLTEPDHGSDPGSMITRAESKGASYILNGTKRWITSGTVADVAVVWAKLDGEIRGFLVEKGRKGFSAPLIPGKFSLRASVTSDLILEDVEIPKSNILPNVMGLKGPLSCLTQARYGIAWGAIGAAMDCYNTALDYVLARQQFGRPLASFQLVQAKLAEMLDQITKMQLICHRLGTIKDNGKLKPAQVSLAKRNNVAQALNIARMARDMLGASGVTDEYPVGRHMCNLESVVTYEGTHDIHTLILGHEATGIQAFK